MANSRQEARKAQDEHLTSSQPENKEALKDEQECEEVTEKTPKHKRQHNQRIKNGHNCLKCTGSLHFWLTVFTVQSCWLFFMFEIFHNENVGSGEH